MAPTRKRARKSSADENKSCKGEVCDKCGQKHGEKDTCSPHKDEGVDVYLAPTEEGKYFPFSGR
jgi:ribosomal protein L32